MIKLDLLMSVIVLGVWIYAFVDVVQTPETNVHHLPKAGWIIVVLLFPVLGSVAWFVAGRPEAGACPRADQRSAQGFPEYERPGRAAAVDPTKDEEFLRQVRARAEEQRERFEQQKRRDSEPGDS